MHTPLPARPCQRRRGYILNTFVVPGTANSSPHGPHRPRLHKLNSPGNRDELPQPVPRNPTLRQSRRPRARPQICSCGSHLAGHQHDRLRRSRFHQVARHPAQPALSLAPLLTTLLMVQLDRLWTAAPPASPIQSLYDIVGQVASGAILSACLRAIRARRHHWLAA